MSKIMIMKAEIIKKFGQDSEEAKFAQHVFSKRSTEYFVQVYNRLMKK